jgi:hypothetical protein
VQTLTSFHHVDSLFSLKADLRFEGTTLTVEFKRKDLKNLFEVPPSFEASSMDRLDGLWQTTCFEVFLNPEGAGSNYYEFNFSLMPAWNAYHFDSFRKPQPPSASRDFSIQNMSWDFDRTSLIVTLENKSPYKNFRVGLTAVLQEKSGDKHYCALSHKGAKPDFHLLESFTLVRGVAK